MNWTTCIKDFSALANAVVGRLSKNKVSKGVDRDRKTIRKWLEGAIPSEPTDVSWLLRVALDNDIDIGEFQTFESIYDFSLHLTYEERLEQMPDLKWLTNCRKPDGINTEFCGIGIDNPFGIASGPLLGNDSWAELMLNLGYGISTFKTRRTAAKRAWDPPQVAFVEELPDLRNYDAATPPEVLVTFDRRRVKARIPNLVNSIGVPSESPAEWQEMYGRIKHHERAQYVGLSVMGDGETQSTLEKDFERAVNVAKDLRPPFIELNLSCPNLEKGCDLIEDPALVARICRISRKALNGTGIPLAIKLPHLDEYKLRTLVKEVGSIVQAICYRNSIKVRPIKFNRDGLPVPAFADRKFGGLTGSHTFSITRRSLDELVKIKREFGLDFGIIAVGGVTTTDHVVELLNAGADVVQGCTAPMFDPLFGWKVRSKVQGLGRLRADSQLELLNTAPVPEFDLLFPRDEVERLSFRNAEVAVKLIGKRSPDLAVSHEAFHLEWNKWMQNRPKQLVGSAQRVPSARNENDWIKIFTKHAKKS